MYVHYYAYITTLSLVYIQYATHINSIVQLCCIQMIKQYKNNYNNIKKNKNKNSNVHKSYKYKNIVERKDTDNIYVYII